MRPDIDFALIRLHRNSKASAFEELCCQLAGEEQLQPVCTSFNRKGLGADGGLECFAVLSDGTETGWQVKYYWEMGSALSSLNESLSTALAKHPKMTRFIACLPFDLSDSRKPDVTTALERWDTWRGNRITQAEASGRKLEIERWDAYELRRRLTASVMAAGRIAYWFDQTLLTKEWFRNNFERTRLALGKRYSPESHIDLPIRRVIEATVLEPRLFSELAAFSETIEKKLAYTDLGDPVAVSACNDAIAELAQAAQRGNQPFSAVALRQVVESARDKVVSWYSTQRDSVVPGSTNSPANAISNLLSVITTVVRSLRAQHWDYVSARALLVTGEAGSGKSHLLADICDYAINEDRPAVMVLGGKLPDAEPWGEILRDLGLPRDLQVDDFLGALNTAAQAAGVRALLVIDALNEKNGKAIWPERLAGVLHDVDRFEWISLVLSCRSTYEPLIIPSSLDEQCLPRIEHGGFSDREARQYLKKREIHLTEEPNSIDEFRTPLFLRICCDALQLEDQALLASNLGGVTAIFELYTGAVIKAVNSRIEANPQRRLVEKTIGALAQEMADTGHEVIAAGRAYDITSPISLDTSIEKDILFQLQSEGLLTAEISGDDDEEEYRFTFQRMSDHAITSSLLERSVGDVANAFTSDTPLRRALLDSHSSTVPGVLEALAVQLPEKFGVELIDMQLQAVSWDVRRAFEGSLLTRSKESFSQRTWAWIEEHGGAAMRFGVLIALSTDPTGDHNAEFLDVELRALSMPERDARWSKYLAESSDSAVRLIDWVLFADQGAIRPERAVLTGVLLCWFLTTSNRLVRDTATKALVVLLASRPGLARTLWSRFKSLDDAYVTERLVCSIYGAAMQGRWDPENLHAVVLDLHADLFVSADFPPNILTRDHALGLVQYAESQHALPTDFEVHLARPPYGGAWPIEYVTEAQIESYTRVNRQGGVYRDEITGSTVLDGDFARYQVDYVVGDWSAATKGSGPIPTAEQLSQRWLESFNSTASPKMLEAYAAFIGAMEIAVAAGAGKKHTAIQQAKRTLRSDIGEEAYAQWSAEASAWHQEGMYQRLANRRGGPAQFNLAWGRRWVCKRAHDLGWSEALHGEFDATISNDRHTHECERIGKKYQWIALYELCARMADNLQPMPGTQSGDFSRLRNIDPSLLITRTHDDGWRHFEEPVFWIQPRPDLGMATVDQALDWLNANEDVFDEVENIEVTDPADEKRWLILNGFETWRGGGRALERETWRRISSFVVRKVDLDRALALLELNHFQGDDDIPLARSGGFRSYLGSHPWELQIDEEQASDEWIRAWRPYGVAKRAVSIRPTTARYRAEASGYDASIDQNIEISLPAGWLMNCLNLRLTDGDTIKFVDGAGVVRFLDPSVSMEGRSAALIDRETFFSFLEKEKCVVVWALSGEKNVYSRGFGNGFGGRWTFTRVFHSQGKEIVALERYQTFEAPSTDQLDELRAAEAEVAVELND
ncbi:hypothetical protein ACNFH5_22570 [Pseudomonas sp. NY15435]|uniref:hypothetical protein n=1 Tax=Pseudomonas sp. NY15435 TaxID=3400358 RepID=UPI003A8379EE